VFAFGLSISYLYCCVVLLQIRPAVNYPVGARKPLVNTSANASPQKTMEESECSKNWVIFDEKSEISRSQSFSPPQSFQGASSMKPPEIPTRRAYHCSATSSLSEDVDLLSMDNDVLAEHLNRGSPVAAEYTPPIPDRLLSPHKQFDVRLPPPSAGSSGLKPRARVRGSVKLPSASYTVPPIPPRKDHDSSGSVRAVVPAARKLDLCETQWMKLEDPARSTIGTNLKGILNFYIMT